MHLTIVSLFVGRISVMAWYKIQTILNQKYNNGKRVCSDFSKKESNFLTIMSVPIDKKIKNPRYTLYLKLIYYMPKIFQKKN